MNKLAFGMALLFVCVSSVWAEESSQESTQEMNVEITAPEEVIDLPFKLEDLLRFRDAMNLIEEKSLYKFDQQKLWEAAITGMYESVDPHTKLLSPEVYSSMKARMNDESIVGIGVMVGIDERFGVPVVVTPIDGTPAKEKGIESGDYIISVGGFPAKDMGLFEATDKIKGTAGTSVTLEIFFKKKQKREEVTLIRRAVPNETVSARMLSADIGYIRISQFTFGTGKEVTKALFVTLPEKNEGRPLRGVVLDLENNGGGEMTNSVITASIFLADGSPILTEWGRDGVLRASYMAQHDEEWPEFTGKLVVLVGSGTASGAEIVAGALQHHRRGPIVGKSKTFGKGLVQTIFELPNGGAAVVTTAEYRAPEKPVQLVGITPDVPVPSVKVEKDADEASGPVLNEALLFRIINGEPEDNFSSKEVAESLSKENYPLSVAYQVLLGLLTEE